MTFTRTPAGSPTALRIATAVWLTVSAVNTIVWLAVSIADGSPDSPWFLWALVGGGAVIGALHLAGRVARRPARPVPALETS